MEQFNTIFSAPEKRISPNLVTASERDFRGENEQQREISEIVANLAAQKTAWVRDYSRNEILRGWASLR